MRRKGLGWVEPPVQRLFLAPAVVRGPTFGAPGAFAFFAAVAAAAGVATAAAAAAPSAVARGGGEERREDHPRDGFAHARERVAAARAAAVLPWLPALSRAACPPERGPVQDGSVQAARAAPPVLHGPCTRRFGGGRAALSRLGGEAGAFVLYFLFRRRLALFRVPVFF